MINRIWKFIARFVSRPAVAEWLIQRAMHTPYSHIEKDGSVYMARYWLFNPYPLHDGGRNRRWQFPISIRIHHILRPDQDRHMHDHPWNARTIILRGWYAEDRQYRGEPLPPGIPEPDAIEHLRRTGDTARLEFGEYHRITKLPHGGVWTIFITGKYRGTWGFLVDGQKIQWRKYLGMEG